MKKPIIALITFAAIAGTVQAGLTLTSEYHYVYTPLAVPAGQSNYRDLEPAGINNSNQVVGTAYVPGFGGPEAFSTSAYNQTKLYPFPGAYADSVGFGINDAGMIAGWGTIAIGEHAFYANFGQSAVDLDGNSQRTSNARAISNNGYFVGSVNNQPALGSIAGHWINSLGATLGNDFFVAGMNDDLQLVGYGHLGGAIYDVGTGAVTQLSAVLGTANNKATAINQAGMVAGTVGNTGFIYNNGAVTYFANNIAWVNSINAAGNVVGALTNGHGFIYVASSHTISDLNTLVPSSIANTWTLTSGTGINDKNSICGMATRPAKAADSAQGWSGTVYQGFTLIIEGLQFGIIKPSLP